MINHANTSLMKLVKNSFHFKINTLQKDWGFQPLCICRSLSIKATDAEIDVALLYSGEEVGEGDFPAPL